ncbi:MAG TPA: hypothetical protein VD788_05995 [Candidatus Polarisedimenticolaceae bacterium]|nr:hypothetical protein [Candidatus Polarisedimenticolaceae bacterium]
MAPPNRSIRATDIDSLRLIALGRIPRCGSCARFRALVRAHDEGELGTALPAVPKHCTHRVCQPLVDRLLAREAPRGGRNVFGGAAYPYAS